MNTKDQAPDSRGSEHKSMTHSTDAETIKRSQGNQAKSNAVQEAKRVLKAAKSDGKS